VSAESARSPREEAERLVAAARGAASRAVEGLDAQRQLRDLTNRFLGDEGEDSDLLGDRGEDSDLLGDRGEDSDGGARTGFATGSAECCICPLCRLIAAVREPNVEFAERLASGAGDIAVGLAGVLRAFGSAMQSGDTWHSATAEKPPSDATGGEPEPPVTKKKVAKKAVVKKAVKRAAPRPSKPVDSTEEQA
jgi:hypothetical protein